MFILWNNIWKLPWICKTFHKQQNRAKKNKHMHKKITLHFGFFYHQFALQSCFLHDDVGFLVLSYRWLTWDYILESCTMIQTIRLLVISLLNFFVLFLPLNSSQTGHVQHTQYHTTYIYITQHKKSLSLSLSSLESCDLT